MLSNSLGKAVTKVREESHLTRKQFADKIKCSLPHVINIEKDRAEISEKLAKRIVDSFSLNENFFDNLSAAKPVLDEWDVEIGWNIKRLRQQNGLTQAELAAAVGIKDAAVISAAETAQRPLSKKKLMMFARFFGVNLTELLRVGGKSTRANKKKDKLITDFTMIVNAKKKPAVYDLIIRLLDEAKLDIKIA